MFGQKKTIIKGLIIPATLGWNGNVPVKNPYLAGIFTPSATKNGTQQKERVTFEVLIQDNSETGFYVEKITCFSSIHQEDPAKRFATRMAKQLVPGRYIEIDGCIEDKRSIGLTNLDGSIVVMNGVQVKKDYTSYIANPGTLRIYNRDSLETMKLLHQQWQRFKDVEHAEWDFLWRPLSLWADQAGNICEMPQDVRTRLEAANKVRAAMPFILGMRTLGFCKVNYPDGATYHDKASDQYTAWLRAQVSAGRYDGEGLPIFTPKSSTPTSTSTAGIPDIMGGGTVKTAEASVTESLAAGSGANPDALMAIVSQLLSAAGKGSTPASKAGTVDLSNLGGPSTANAAAGIPLL